MYASTRCFFSNFNSRSASAVAALVSVLTLLVSPVAISSDGAVANTAAAEVSSILGSNVTFNAFFEQTVFNHRGRAIQESHGRIWVERPGRFRWQATEPYPQTVVSDGKQLWFYDPDLEQVTIRPFDNNLSSTPGLLLSGEVAQLESSFTVAVGDITPEIEGLARYVLTPKGTENLFSELELVFKDDLLVSMQIRDSLGQLTEFRFSDIAVNEPIDSGKFHLKIPEGVDVIGP